MRKIILKSLEKMNNIDMIIDGLAKGQDDIVKHLSDKDTNTGDDSIIFSLITRPKDVSFENLVKYLTIQPYTGLIDNCKDLFIFLQTDPNLPFYVSRFIKAYAVIDYTCININLYNEISEFIDENELSGAIVEDALDVIVEETKHLRPVADKPEYILVEAKDINLLSKEVKPSDLTLEEAEQILKNVIKSKVNVSPENLKIFMDNQPTVTIIQAAHELNKSKEIYNKRLDVELMRLYGPVNPLLDSEFTPADYIYGGPRMFLDADMNLIEVDNCYRYTCKKKIQHLKYCMRIPLYHGGWSDETYCSIECALFDIQKAIYDIPGDDVKNVVGESMWKRIMTETKLLDLYTEMIKKNGIYDFTPQV